MRTKSEFKQKHKDSLLELERETPVQANWRGAEEWRRERMEVVLLGLRQHGLSPSATDAASQGEEL